MKAILVIDMPDDCPVCPMAHWNKIDEFTGCDAVSGKKYAINDKEYAESSSRPLWCPLRPLPEKDEEPEDDMTDYIQEDYDRMASYFYGLINGRNNVINEILGETE